MGLQKDCFLFLIDSMRQAQKTQIMTLQRKKDCDSEDIAIKSFFLGPQAENAPWLQSEWGALLDRWIHWRKSLFPRDGIAISLADQKDPLFCNYQERMGSAIDGLLKKIEAEVPKFTPRYMGHMMAEASLPAILGHIVALLHNSNITTKESAKTTSTLEVEAIEQLATMLDFPKTAFGHFTSGGTVANIEALWRSRYQMDLKLSIALLLRSRGGGPTEDDLFAFCHHPPSETNKLKASFQEAEREAFSFIQNSPWEIQTLFQKHYGSSFAGPVVLIPAHRHYSWKKAVSLLGFGEKAIWPISLDQWGRLNVLDLKENIEKAKAARRPVAMVVSVLGSTELGTVDAIHEIQDLLEKYQKEENLFFWHHVDAAYGGYFCSLVRGETQLVPNKEYLSKALRAVARVNSATIDPHKLGYVPYSCGALLVRDQNHYVVNNFAAPYLDKDPGSRWAHTLEGSRSSTGAVATWLSNLTVGLTENGYGRILLKGLQSKQGFLSTISKQKPEPSQGLNNSHDLSNNKNSIVVMEAGELNIQCFFIASKNGSLKDSNTLTKRVYEHFQASPHFSVSKTILNYQDYKLLIERHLTREKIRRDEDHLFLVRLVFMNPFLQSKNLQVDLLDEFLKELCCLSQ